MSAATDLQDALAAAAALTDPMARAEATWTALADAPVDLDLDTPLAEAEKHGLIAPLAAERMALQHQAKRTTRLWVNPTDGQEMIWISGGEAPLGGQIGGQTVSIPGFSLGRHPVTEAQFHRFVADAGYADGQPSTRGDDFPVTQVSQTDALAYCRWAGLSLPTEWMWEKAAVGTDGRRFPWGNTWITTKLARIRADAPVPIGSYSTVRTAYGCQDMIGNVGERCLPTADSAAGMASVQPVVTPAGDDSSYVPVRGSAYLRHDSGRDRMRPTHRRRLSVGRRNDWVGFRTAFSWVQVQA